MKVIVKTFNDPSSRLGRWYLIGKRNSEPSTIGVDFGTVPYKTNIDTAFVGIDRAVQFAVSHKNLYEHVSIYTNDSLFYQYYIAYCNNPTFVPPSLAPNNLTLWNQISPYFDNYWYDFHFYRE